jgi:hypothetical protein
VVSSSVAAKKKTRGDVRDTLRHATTAQNTRGFLLLPTNEHKGQGADDSRKLHAGRTEHQQRQYKSPSTPRVIPRALMVEYPARPVACQRGWSREWEGRMDGWREGGRAAGREGDDLHTISLCAPHPRTFSQSRSRSRSCSRALSRSRVRTPLKNILTLILSRSLFLSLILSQYAQRHTHTHTHTHARTRTHPSPDTHRTFVAHNRHLAIREFELSAKQRLEVRFAPLGAVEHGVAYAQLAQPRVSCVRRPS